MEAEWTTNHCLSNPRSLGRGPEIGRRSESDPNVLRSLRQQAVSGGRLRTGIGQRVLLSAHKRRVDLGLHGPAEDTGNDGHGHEESHGDCHQKDEQDDDDSRHAETLPARRGIGPRFNLDKCHPRKFSHGEGATSRAMLAEGRHIGLVHTVEVTHMAKEHGGLDDIVH